MSIEILVEFVLSSLFDLVLELSVRGVWRARSALVVLVCAVVAGAFSTWLVPRRLFGAPLLPGASVVLLPFLNGAVMHGYGTWSAHHRQDRSFIATFWGGALFGLGFSAARFLLIDRP